MTYKSLTLQLKKVIKQKFQGLLPNGFLFKKLISELNNNIEKGIVEETFSKKYYIIITTNIMYVFNVILKHILKTRK
jgi:hypothetical protein